MPEFKSTFVYLEAKDVKEQNSKVIVLQLIKQEYFWTYPLFKRHYFLLV